MKRVVHFTSGRGGEIEMVKKISAGCQAENIENSIVALTGNYALEKTPLSTVFDEEIPSFRFFRRLKESLKIYDIVFNHYIFNYFSMLVLLAIRVMFRSKKMVCIFHGISGGPGSIPRRIYYFIRKMVIIHTALLAADRIIFLTHTQKRDFTRCCLLKKALSRKCEVIYNFIEKKSILTVNKKFETPLQVVYVGRLSIFKGVADLIEVIKQFDGSRDVSFHVIGLGALKKEMSKLSNVRIYGSVENDSLFRYIDQCHLLVLPSYAETFGIVIIEAMARGLVVMASDLPEIREYFKNGQNGTLIVPGDTDGMIKTICRYKNHPELMRSISRRNLDDVKNFSDEQQVCKYLEVVRQLT